MRANLLTLLVLSLGLFSCANTERSVSDADSQKVEFNKPTFKKPIYPVYPTPGMNPDNGGSSASSKEVKYSDEAGRDIILSLSFVSSQPVLSTADENSSIRLTVINHSDVKVDLSDLKFEALLNRDGELKVVQDKDSGCNTELDSNDWCLMSIIVASLDSEIKTNTDLNMTFKVSKGDNIVYEAVVGTFTFNTKPGKSDDNDDNNDDDSNSGNDDGSDDDNTNNDVCEDNNFNCLQWEEYEEVSTNLNDGSDKFYAIEYSFTKEDQTEILKESFFKSEKNRSRLSNTYYDCVNKGGKLAWIVRKSDDKFEIACQFDHDISGANDYVTADVLKDQAMELCPAGWEPLTVGQDTTFIIAEDTQYEVYNSLGMIKEKLETVPGHAGSIHLGDLENAKGLDSKNLRIRNKFSFKKGVNFSDVFPKISRTYCI